MTTPLAESLELPPQNNRLSTGVLLGLTLNQVLFGINYLFSKKVLEFLPPLLWAGLRALIVGFALALVAWRLKQLNIKAARREALPLALLGLIGITLNQGFFLLGLRYTTPTNSALLNTLIPVFTLGIVVLRRQEKIGVLRVLGFFFAFCGILVLHHIEHFSFSDTGLLGDLYTLGNAFFYACFLAFGKNFMSKHNYLWAMTWIFISGGIFLALAGYSEWASFQWHPMPPLFWASALFGVSGGTLIPYLLVGYCLGKAPSSTVALFVYIAPVVASVLSCLFLGESITLRLVLSSSFIFLGVFLALYPKGGYRRKRLRNKK